MASQAAKYSVYEDVWYVCTWSVQVLTMCTLHIRAWPDCHVFVLSGDIIVGIDGVSTHGMAMMQVCVFSVCVSVHVCGIFRYDGTQQCAHTGAQKSKGTYMHIENRHVYAWWIWVKTQINKFLFCTHT
jgi:hypothetical protein